jgi:hypothetical protein
MASESYATMNTTVNRQLPVPSLILNAGSSGVGKTTVIKDILPDIPGLFLLEKDVYLEQFLHTNPFLLHRSDGTMEKDARYSFTSPEYARHFRDQAYASMFAIGYQNALLDRSSVLDACYIGWLKDPCGRISLARRVVNMHQSGRIDLGRIRMPILFFYVTDSDVVRQRLIRRAEQDPAAKDRDWSKISTPEAWEKQVSKEPVTWFPDLDQYTDLLGIDLTQEYAGEHRGRVRGQILEHLYRGRPIAETGIFKDETLERTLLRFSV